MGTRTLGLAVLALSLALSITACGGGDGGSSDNTVTPAPNTPPTSAPTLAVERVFASLPDFTSPVAMLQSPGDATRWYVVQQGGQVLFFANTSNVSTKTVFVDISNNVVDGGEMGLLGMAFHPAYPSDPRVFLYYTNDSAGLVSRLSSFTVNSGGDSLDAASERILITISQPENNHNGGALAFGPDGYLYLGLGDGGGGNDQHGTIGNAQSLTTLLGKIIRIDVDGVAAGTYRAPTSNPYAANAQCGTNGTGAQNCPELFAWGLRNPWRFSFDRQGGQLWVADVGQGALEEVDKVDLGGNYGWRCYEGTSNTGMSCGAPQNPLPPIAEYGRTLGRSITGGYVYRGTSYSSLVGRYVFGDFATGSIWSIPTTTTPTLTMTEGFQSGLSISSFAEAQDGELYVVDYGGRIYHLTAS